MSTKTKESKKVKVTKTKVCALEVNNVIKQADKLFVQREHFEKETLARTNKALYQLLADVYALYLETAKNKECMKLCIEDMKAELKERGLRPQRNTPPLTVFVRYIFNSDRKRSYNYTQTLLAALQKGIEPNKLAEFISDNSGVEEIKRSRNVKPEVIKRRQEIEAAIPVVKAQLESMSSEVTVKLTDSSVDLSDGTKYAFVIARKNANGEMELLQAIPKTTAALESIAFKALAEQVVEYEADNAIVVKGKAKDIAVKAAAKSVSKSKTEQKAA